MFLGVKSGWRVGLTTLPASVSRLSENVGASTSRNPKGLHGLYKENFTFFLHVFVSNHFQKLKLSRVNQEIGWMMKD
jgi:hypothetical protein